MKGQATIKLNQATMVEALQQYFDAQFKTPHVVTSVRKDSAPSHGADTFEVELEEVQSDVG